MNVNNVHFLCYFYLLKFCLVDGQWNNGHYCPNKSPPNTFSLPVQYVPVPPSSNRDGSATYRQYDPFKNGPFAYDPYYQNYPGDAEVRSLQFSYPGQPVIVINNDNDGDCRRRERICDIEELLTLMFAVGGGHHHHHKPKTETPRGEPDVPRYPPPYPYYGYPSSGMGESVPENMKLSRESPKPSKINITIILPSTFSSTNVQVENKIKEDKKNKGEIDEVGN